MRRKLRFKAAVEDRDTSAVAASLAEDVVLHSPVLSRPFAGREIVAHVLSLVDDLLEDFVYTRELHGEREAALFFKAKVGSREIEGVDLLGLDADGLVERLTVSMRPMTALTTFSDEMASRLNAAGVTPLTDMRFRQMMEHGDVAGIGGLLADDVLFHSPVLYRPFMGRELVSDALQILRTFFSEATYTDEFRREGKTILMFTARIRGREAEGVQQLLLDKDGLIRDLKVWLRPLTAALALSESMAPHLDKTEDGYAVYK